jgi:hypothetical protein
VFPDGRRARYSSAAAWLLRAGIRQPFRRNRFMEETMRACIHTALLAAVLAVADGASRVRADIYRCAQEQGSVSYQQIPCNAGSEPVVLPDQGAGGSALRAGERALLKQYADKRTAPPRKSAETSRQAVTEDKACWRTRKQLEAVRTKLHRGYRLREGEALRRKRDNYQDYLRRFCSSG